MTPLTNDLARHLIAAWKTISIALTGAFGILGLLTTFRDDLTKKITWAGKATLAGILASSVMGVIAQLVDAETQARSDSKAIARTEAIVANTGVAVKRINRLLVPTTDLTLEVVYNIRCGQPQSPKICE